MNPHQMGLGRIAGRTELGEVATAAEGGTAAIQIDSVIDGSATATSSASHSASRVAASNALRTQGRPA